MSEDLEVVQEPTGEPNEQQEQAQPPQPPAGGLPPAVLEELQQLRQTNRQREEELHALRVATLRSAAAPQVDPVEVAYQRIQKESDPDAFKYIGPALRPLLEELHSQRVLNEQLSQNLQYLAQRDHEREVHTQLATLIPDLPALGPKLLELVGKLPPPQQKIYADNPALFVPLAESLRQQGGKRGTAAARAAQVMDTGGGADRVIPTTADAIASMNPASKDFAALQRSFYGSDV